MVRNQAEVSYTPKNLKASYEPLTPLSFLERIASVMPESMAVIDGDKRCPKEIEFGEIPPHLRRKGSEVFVTRQRETKADTHIESQRTIANEKGTVI
jgi:hypothetical protein